MKKIRVKYFVLGLLLLLEIVSLTLMYKSSHNKEVVLDEVSLRDFLKSDMISIMTDETGDGIYTEYTSSSTFPSSYTYNASKSQCINEKGNVVKDVLTFDGTKAILTSNEGMHCTLYFDKCGGPKGTVLDGKTGITKCEVGGMYRYQGTDNVNNYICFGTSNKSTCTSSTGKSKYLYRIIGVTSDGQLKLILADKFSSVSWGYPNGECNTNSSKCDWNGSYLFNSLNGKDNKYGGSFMNNSNYSYLNNDQWKKLIDTNHSWKYGVISDDSKVKTYNGIDVYNIESQFNNTVTAAIGAPYIHDFLLSYPEGNPGNSTNVSKSWMMRDLSNLVSSYGYWSMTKKENKTTPSTTQIAAYAYVIGGSGIGSDFTDPDVYSRPVFYLKSDTVLKSGSTGSMSDPYLIDGITAEPVERKTNLTRLEENDSSNNLSSSEDGGMYRYKGTKTQVTNNYICFGTTSKTQCVNNQSKYLYRIVGVTKAGSMLIMLPQRFSPTLDDYPTSGYYGSSAAEAQESGKWKNRIWSDSNIYKQFHGIKYLVGSTSNSYSTNLYIDSSTYDYMSSGSEWLSRIDSHAWNYHVVTLPSTINSGFTIEQLEIDDTGLTTSKIGGLYVYDYLYSVSKTGFVDCLQSSVPSACTNAWLAEYDRLIFMSRDEMSCQSNNQSCFFPFIALNSGRATGGGSTAYNYLAFYIGNKEEIESGTGSKTNPYILSSYKNISCSITPTYSNNQINLGSNVQDSSGNTVSTLDSSATGVYSKTVTSGSNSATCYINIRNPLTKYNLVTHSVVTTASGTTESTGVSGTYATSSECSSHAGTEESSDAYHSSRIEKYCVSASYCPIGYKSIGSKCYGY